MWTKKKVSIDYDSNIDTMGIRGNITNVGNIMGIQLGHRMADWIHQMDTWIPWSPVAAQRSATRTCSVHSQLFNLFIRAAHAEVSFKLVLQRGDPPKTLRGSWPWHVLMTWMIWGTAHFMKPPPINSSSLSLSFPALCWSLASSLSLVCSEMVCCQATGITLR
jgi:hypothetical protein